MFQKILIANRGEIACRVAATARRMGIRTVAVYSDADANAQHVKACDEAVHIGPASPRESYLRADRILEAAKATGAQAVHPGYGFLSENEDFAQACEEAGIAFIGPPASAIAAMGSKSAAKALMEKAGVPLVPGYHGDNQDAALLKDQADAMGYPVLIKASAGGGGKGMRAVQQAADFEAALASCQREAQASFGSAHVLVERYVTQPRHIEIQLFGDKQGNYVYLFERDCSVQRRHQKVLEEAPAPGMTAERRSQMGEAAIAAARSVGYVGAGTVEFICEQDGRFYFMEMNTRLQVEHPVTEAITGLDLVEWQLRVAAGEPLPLQQEQLQLKGHAIEARICAENPSQQFLPATGTLQTLRTPASSSFEVAPVRVDSGVREGDVISPYYDSMIAKLIVWGEDRDAALSRLDAALRDLHITGLHTNVAFVRRVIHTDSFAKAKLDTALIEREHTALFQAPGVPAHIAVGAAMACLLQPAKAPHGHRPRDPWAVQDGWRLSGQPRHREVLMHDGEPLTVITTRVGAQDYELQIGDRTLKLRLSGEQGDQLDIQLDGQRLRFSAYQHEGDIHVFLPQGAVHLQRVNPLTQTDHSHQGTGRLTALMPGKVVALLVKEGQQVKQGEPLAVTEAMKMEHTLTAPQDGTVAAILCAVGDQVAEGVELLRIE
ncbi:MAG: acetyl/propionyl/methylcrotonyl-CoA carboxylase subunit alpha [Aquabacterium sp.]|uniref:acetyl/propionyl/methylcrotonyl-CoA carboxylase subunit alpha n=1 Tax=Aquabacterium sp. TaxID=1872578 RepID=UPI0011FA19D8|nr:acetyl/propionyl/methylcrotonyl-CoA carboxylase subunit alpha [Aquabacterium sp.]TAK98034.1 MAG: acetyl/propionyl/methylcrotonyl-CoA carboxylase subunit alpha [Aquabacterium sp.]